MDNFYRASYIDIDLTSILHNVTSIRQQHPHQKMIAVVKADCYGFGSRPMTKFLEQHGVDAFAVATLDEAIELRQAGVTSMILVMGVIPSQYILLAHQYQLTLTIPSVEWLKEIQPYVTQSIDCHLKIDTGMGRIGIKTEAEIESILDIVNETPQIKIKGVFTHFACADEEDPTKTYHQYHLFQQLLTFIKDEIELEYIHAQNSAAIELFSLPECNAFRYGISLYGYYPSSTVAHQDKILHLQPALQLKTQVIHCKLVEAGETIGYGATYTANQPTYIVTLPIGYADGWQRRLQGMTVIVGHEKGTIVGRICMDHCMVAVTQAYDINTPVTLIGNQAGMEISCEDVAKYAHTINYEILCGLSKRLPRRYFLNGNCQTINNELLN